MKVSPFALLSAALFGALQPAAVEGTGDVEGIVEYDPIANSNYHRSGKGGKGKGGKGKPARKPSRKPSYKPTYKPDGSPSGDTCSGLEILPPNNTDTGFNYSQLARAWWMNALSVDEGAGECPQQAEGVHVLPPNFSMGFESFNRTVEYGSYIMTNLFSVIDIWQPSFGADYFAAYDPLIKFMGIRDPSILDDLQEKSVIGTTMLVLGLLDLYISIEVDGCALDPKTAFVQTGLFETMPVGSIPKGNMAHGAGYFALLPPLGKGRHTVEIKVSTEGRGVIEFFLFQPWVYHSLFDIYVGHNVPTIAPKPVVPPTVQPSSPAAERT